MITSTDVETLIVQLERNAGAHAHTAGGKARNYLRRVADKPNARFTNCSGDEFVQAAKTAAYKGEWEQLEKVMRGWW